MPVQRITQRAVQINVGNNMQGALARLSRLQEQLSSGRQLQRPSDNPASTVAALRFRADIKRNEQLKRNADDSTAWLNSTDRALTSGLSVLNRARALTLQGINGSMQPSDREAIAAEIDGLRESMLDVANSTYLNRPLFAGTAASTTAYDATGTYLGDSGAVNHSVAANVTVRSNVTGPEAFGPAGADVFTLLGDIANHLRTNPDQLSTDLTGLDAAFTRMTNAVSSVGARANDVEGLRDRIDSSVLEAQNGLAEVESVDLPATVVQLQLQEVAYQAALSATSRVIQPSLVDFLR